MTQAYTLTVHVPLDPAATETLLRTALQEQGFGVLSEIDVQATLQAKLGHEMGTYRILGACNPVLAREAVSVDPDIGALLPCNVVIRGTDDGTTDVVAIDPRAMLSVGAAALEPLAADARTRIEAALAALSEAAATQER